MAYNILVADDSHIVRAVIAKTLRLAGVQVGALFEAANGREALDILKRQWIDLVFADIHMPVMTGLELIEEMNKDGILGSTPVVVVSAEGNAPRIESLKKKGISAYIRKPFTPEELRKIVSDLLAGAP